MEYISINDAAEKWSCTVRTVQRYCKEGLIEGAVKSGKSWMLPSSCKKPGGLEEDNNNRIKDLPLPRRSVFLDMTNLYHSYGQADKCAMELSRHKEAQTLFRAEIAYIRGDIKFVKKTADYFLESHSGLFAVLAGGMLLAQCAMWDGDVDLWYKAKKHIYEAPIQSETDRDIVELTISAVESLIRRTVEFPEWFSVGDFERLPYDCLPAAKVYYIKYLMIDAHKLAVNQYEFKDVQGLGLVRVIPYIVEPMIAQCIADKTVLPELYLRLMCAVAHHNTGESARAIKHLDKAIKIAIADGLYGVLAEYRRHFDYLLDERLALVDEAALKKVKELYKKLFVGWNTLHNAVHEKNVSNHLSIREREVAKLAAFGLSNSEIANRLKISVNSVKSALAMAMNKTGACNRATLGAYI